MRESSHSLPLRPQVPIPDHTGEESARQAPLVCKLSPPHLRARKADAADLLAGGHCARAAPAPSIRRGLAHGQADDAAAASHRVVCHRCSGMAVAAPRSRRCVECSRVQLESSVIACREDSQRSVERGVALRLLSPLFSCPPARRLFFTGTSYGGYGYEIEKRPKPGKVRSAGTNYATSSDHSRPRYHRHRACTRSSRPRGRGAARSPPDRPDRAARGGHGRAARARVVSTLKAGPPTSTQNTSIHATLFILYN